MDMVKILIGLFMMVSVFAYGVYVDLSTNNMPTAYDTSAGSALGGCAKGNLFSIYNGTNESIAWAKGLGTKNHTPTADLGEVPASTGVNRDGYVYFNGAVSVFVRSLSGSPITSGYIMYDCGRK
jgi:hypothetical protein